MENWNEWNKKKKRKTNNCLMCVGFLVWTVMTYRVSMATVASILILACCAIAVRSQPYHVIVVGAGSAGSVAAERLSRNPLISVLLVDEGGDVNGEPGTEAQICPSSNCGIGPEREPFCEHIFTPDEPITGAQIYVPRPKAAGGSSAINTAVCGRGSAEWWNANEATYGVTGWDWASIQEVWTDIENFATPLTSPPSPDHGYNGFIDTRLYPMTPTLEGLAASIVKTAGIPYFPDANLGTVPSAAVKNTERCHGYDAATGEFVRQNTFVQAILPHLAGGSGTRRPNLSFLPYTVVTKILFNAAGTAATGIQYLSNGESGSAALVAGGQLVLAAGGIGTPKLLMLSGVGNCATLAALPPNGVRCVYNQPNIGLNWRTTMNAQMFFVGPSSPSGAALMADWRSTAAKPFADIEIGIGPILNDSAQTGPGVTLYLFQIGQMIYYNSGSLTLQDTEPTTAPVPVVNYEFPGGLLQAFNMARAVAADFSATTGLPMIEAVPGVSVAPVGDTEAIISWIASAYQIDFAYHGGVQFGGSATVNTNSSCDSRGRLWGLPNVRIADNSIYPTHQNHAAFTSAMTSGGMIAKFIIQDAAAGSLW